MYKLLFIYWTWFMLVFQWSIECLALDYKTEENFRKM